MVATDAPLLPHQLTAPGAPRDAGPGAHGQRVGERLGRHLRRVLDGQPAAVAGREGAAHADVLPNEAMNPLFAATVQATEEAIVNALVAAETMAGVDGHRVLGLPHERLREILARHGRLLAR